MKFIERKDIDAAKWDERIATASDENVFSYSWYLDAVADHWGGIVDGDYETILPVTYSKKLGVKQFVQATYTREFEIFGNGFDWKDAIEVLSKDFKSLQFRTKSGELPFNKEVRHHQFLELTKDLESNYSTNAKRLIKKAAQKFSFRASSDPAPLIRIFSDTAFQKIDSLSENDLHKISSLMKNGLNQNAGELIEILDKDQIVGAGYFLLDKNRVTYLKGAALESAKKEGAMFALMNYAFQTFRDDYSLFDFGGSDLDTVSTFYKKFGATDRTYYNYTVDNLPIWFKTLKKFKK